MVLLRLLEDWKAPLDNDKYVTVVLMDLSKPFNCLPHKMILSKLSTYGLSDEAVLLLKSYLSDRKQQIKLTTAFWLFECDISVDCVVHHHLS